MKATRKPAPALWLFILLVLAACGQVTNDVRLEPQALILTVTSEHDSDAGSLRAAIEQARSGNTITFASNVRSITLLSELLITKDLTIIGPESGITISGGGSVQVMLVSNGVALNLDGLTIANGKHSFGGGIDNFGTLTITNSTFLDNRADNLGGGIHNEGTLTITNSTFSENNAGSGGAIRNNGALTITNSTFSGNSAQFSIGGGIDNRGTLTVTNSTISGNSANVLGGGIFNAVFSIFNITNSTISGNSATHGGGGIDNRGALTLTNSIVALNTASTGPDISGTVSTASHNLIGNTAGSSGITHGVNGNIVNATPKLGPLADNSGPTKTVALLAGSPAIDAAHSSSCPATDQRGVVRHQGAACDIGAFEKEFITVTLSVNTTGTVHRTTGEVTVEGSVTCSAPTSVVLDVSVSQEQKQGRTTATVTGSESVPVSCDGSTPWTATVSANSGGFKNGGVTMTVTDDANPPNQETQTVRLSWVR